MNDETELTATDILEKNALVFKKSKENIDKIIEECSVATDKLYIKLTGCGSIDKVEFDRAMRSYIFFKVMEFIGELNEKEK